MTVVVKRREGRIRVDDGGAAVARAGLPAGWREVARRIEDEFCVNVSRQGVVLLPVGGTEIEARIEAASSAFANDLLDLQ
jgi:hypothetical protein